MKQPSNQNAVLLDGVWEDGHGVKVTGKINSIYAQLLKAERRYNEIVKKLEDEIFNEEEWLYKEHSEDTGYLNGLRFALKLLRENQ